MLPLFNLTALYDQFPGRELKDALILTANQRLASEIDTAFDHSPPATGLPGHVKPEIFAVESWLSRCWRQLVGQGDERALSVSPLSPGQDLLIWKQIIRDDRSALLLKPWATAKAAQAALKTLTLWHVSVSPAFDCHPDCARFARWLKQYDKHCRREGFANQNRCAEIVLKAFREHRLPKQKLLLAVGFQKIPPLYQALFDQASYRVSEYRFQGKPGKSWRQEYETTEQEIKAAAHWSKQQLEKNHDLRIAVIVPDLKARRHQVERLFTAEFEPQYLLPKTPRYQAPFNISAGLKLGETPVIHTALLLFKACRGSLDTLDWLSLLHSPFLFYQYDFHPVLCDAEIRIRRNGSAQLTSVQLLKILAALNAQEEAIDHWLSALTWLTEKQPLPEQRAPISEWLELMVQLLEQFQWPGARALDSMEYQQIKRWHRLLDEFSEFSLITGEVTFSSAVRLLDQLIAAIEFQAESARSPIQILGVLEGGGLSFDAIRLLEVTDRNWPPSPAPNPFIPLAVQIEQSMPHANAEKELDFTKRLFAEYLQGAGLVIASYARWEKDQPLQRSRLLDNIPEKTSDANDRDDCSHPYHQLLWNKADLTDITDNKAPPLADRGVAVSGGAQVLKNQAACPFKAFAIHRLYATPLEPLTRLIQAADRGVILHRALELIWKKIETLQNLKALEPSSLQETVNRSVTSAVLAQAQRRPDLLSDTLIQLEIERLGKQLTQWLALEMERPSFRIKALEHSVDAEICGIRLKLRIDRVDQLEDGGLLLIDYKSGECGLKQWHGERPDDPQLPLYAVSLISNDENDEVVALAFAQINADRQRFVGIGQSRTVAPGITAIDKIRGWEMANEWLLLKSEWRMTLERLITEFLAGEANVSPRDRSVCRFCHLGSLCRIKDQRCFDGRFCESGN